MLVHLFCVDIVTIVDIYTTSGLLILHLKS